MKNLTAPTNDANSRRIHIKFEKLMIKALTQPEEEKDFEVIYLEKKLSMFIQAFPKKQINVKNQEPSSNPQKNLQLSMNSSTLRLICVDLKRILNIKVVIFEVLLLNIYAFFFLILSILLQNSINQYIFCGLDTSNVFLVFYVIIRETYMALYFYSLQAYYVVFSLTISSINILLYVFPVNCVLLLLSKIYEINPLHIYIDIHGSCFLLSLLIILFYYKKHKISWHQVKGNFGLITMLLVFQGFFNYYAMKSYVIPMVKGFTLDIAEGKIFFQLFLFIYFRFYNMIYLKGITKYAKYATLSKNQKECKDAILLFSKYYILDAVCSCLPAVITADLWTKEAWLGMVNYLYQLYIIYDQKNTLLVYGKKIVYRCFKRKYTENLNTNVEEMTVKEIFSVSLNEIMIIVYLQLILMFSFRRLLASSILQINCYLEMRKDIEIKIENIFIALVLNLCLMISLITRKDNPLKLVWNMESYGAFFKIYYIMLLHFVVDLDMQYFLYFYYLQKK